MEEVLDVFRVLYEPGKVFERVREKPRVLVPWLVISVLLVIVMYMMLPYIMDASAPQIAKAEARGAGGGATARAMIPIFSVYALPLFIFIGITISAGFLWLFMSLFGGDAKFKTLLSISTYTSIMFVLGSAVTLLSLKMHPGVKVSSQQDLQSPLGLQKLMSDLSPFVFSLLGGINLFSILGVVLTAIGLETALKASRGTAYTVAIVSMLAGLVIQASFTLLGS